MSEFTDSQGVHLNPTRKVKRKYDKMCICSECEKFSVQATIVVRYICHDCGKGNNGDEAAARYESWDKGDLELKTPGKAPALIRVNDEKLAYTKFRDEHQIRSDMFSRGQTRDSMGSHQFRRALRKELLHEKCHRGEASDVD